MKIFSTAYLPPVEYLAQLMKEDKVLLDIHENYVRQSYRNRCLLASDKGIQALSVPVQKTNGHYSRVKEMAIDHHIPWQRNHWRAIQTNYNNSPFFLYYQDDLVRFFEKNYRFLIDFNNDIFAFILKKLKLKCEISFSEAYVEKNAFDNDLRNVFNPKQNVNQAQFPFYQQVFTDKESFLANLSILDVICNLGSESSSYLSSVILNDHA